MFDADLIKGLQQGRKAFARFDRSNKEDEIRTDPHLGQGKPLRHLARRGQRCGDAVRDEGYTFGCDAQIGEVLGDAAGGGDDGVCFSQSQLESLHMKGAATPRQGFGTRQKHQVMNRDR